MALVFLKADLPDGGLEPEVIEPSFVFLETSLSLSLSDIETCHMGVRSVQPTVRFSYLETRMCLSDRLCSRLT